jgi:hypothetical protein
MALVRLFLIAVLALQAAGLPVAAEAPCPAAEARGEVCCMRHHTETGGDVIGHCGCQVAPQPLEPEASVSTPPTAHVIVAAMLSDGGSLDTEPSPESAAWFFTSAGGGPIHSPPRLTGSGFRC